MPVGERAMSKRDMHEEWETPDTIFAPLHREFEFTLDAAALPRNAKVQRFFVPKHACNTCRSLFLDGDCGKCDGLVQHWTDERVWLNPPYGHRNLSRWMEKAWRESQERGALVVCLVPAHTGQRWWHDWVWFKAAEVRWIRGKVKFVGASSCAPFPSVIVIYRPETADL